MKKSELKNGMIVQITTGPWIDFDDMGYVLNNRILFQESTLDLDGLDENLEAIYSSNICSCDIEGFYDNIIKHRLKKFLSKEIGEGLFTSSRSVSGAMRKLVADGYVDKSDDSPIVYSLTELGKKYSK